jgi:pimeloyl-ACP methyl ester carboxylesterase
MASAIARKTIDTARGRVSWLEAGAGWPVVLLHAFPLSARMWRPQLERVPDDSRIIAPELGSLVGGGPHERTLDDYAADVGALLDAIKIDSAAIGGLSMGGYIAFAMFRQSPARFARMILADTRPQADTPQGREGRQRLRQLLARGGVSAVVDEMLPKLLAPRTAGERPDVVAEVRGIAEALPPGQVDAAIGAMMSRPDSTPDLARISCATLVIVGEEDALTPVAEAEAMHGAIARSVLITLAGAGHLSNLEAPDAFSTALADFLLAPL